MSKISKTSSIMSNESENDLLINDDSILNIFDYLSLIEMIDMRRVCKRWKRLIDYKLNRRNCLAITISNDNDIEEDYNEFQQRCDCSEAKHLITSNDCIVKQCRAIKDGSTTLYIITDRQLNKLFKFCPNIRALSLEFTIFDRNVWNFFKTNCPKNLEHMDFSHSQGLIDEVIRFIVDNCGSTLRHILLVDSDISESSLKFVLEKCQNLEILDISSNVRINGNCFSLFGNHIKRLSINNCWNIDINGIKSLVSGNGKLINHLEINGEFIDNNIFEVICDNLIYLKKLEVECIHVNRKVLKKLSNFTQLEELTICLPPINFDDILIEIMKKCRKIKRLRIEGLITDISLKQLGFFLNCLEVLSISTDEVILNKKISDDSCESLSKLIYLRHLDIQNSNIGDKLIDVIKSCEKLTTIEIDGCKKVTNNLLEFVINKVKQNVRQNYSIFARDTKLTMPDMDLPNNLELILE